mmetsp:Transcript_2746/g.8222  ORF Transcript_2746/g.8222 Transcript_2746/m.8222 type:complete len:322 (+) Transcript_2746:361-1326(+)
MTLYTTCDWSVLTNCATPVRRECRWRSNMGAFPTMAWRSTPRSRSSPRSLLSSRAVASKRCHDKDDICSARFIDHRILEMSAYCFMDAASRTTAAGVSSLSSTYPSPNMVQPSPADPGATSMPAFLSPALVTPDSISWPNRCTWMQSRRSRRALASVASIDTSVAFVSTKAFSTHPCSEYSENSEASCNPLSSSSARSMKTRTKSPLDKSTYLLMFSRCPKMFSLSLMTRRSVSSITILASCTSFFRITRRCEAEYWVPICVSCPPCSSFPRASFHSISSSQYLRRKYTAFPTFSTSRARPSSKTLGCAARSIANPSFQSS